MDATCFTRSQCLSTSWGVVTHGQGESEMLGMEMDLWAHSKAGNSRPYFVIFSQWNYLKMIIKLENDAGITPLFLNVSHRDRSPFLSCFSFITSFAQFWSSYNPLTFRSPFMSVLCKHWGRASDEEQAGPRGAPRPKDSPIPDQCTTKQNVKIAPSPACRLGWTRCWWAEVPLTPGVSCPCLLPSMAAAAAENGSL